MTKKISNFALTNSSCYTSYRSRGWTCVACQSSNLELLPDIPKTNAQPQSIDKGDMPQFSFAYAENKSVQSGPAPAETNNSNESQELLPPPSVNDSLSSNDLKDEPVTSQVPELNNDTASGNKKSLISHNTAQGSTTSGQGQASTTGDSSHPHHPSSNLSPRWLDGLIMGLVAILIGLVIRKVF
jgi:hypothetical protein